MSVAGTSVKEKPIHGRLLYNLRMPRTVRKFCFVAFFTCLTLANWSSQEARGQVTTKEEICSAAIRWNTPNWETLKFFRRFVVNAKQLGLSERDCARLTGRFGERQLRRANSNLEKVKTKITHAKNQVPPQSKAKASVKSTSTTSKDAELLRKTLTSLQKTVKGLEKQITTTKTRLNINQTKHDKKLDELQIKIQNLLSENKKLSKNLKNVQSESKTARESLEKKQTTLEKEVTGFEKLFVETAGSNNAIRKAMSDLETRSKQNQAAIENIRSKPPGSNKEKGSNESKADPTSSEQKQEAEEKRIAAERAAKKARLAKLRTEPEAKGKGLSVVGILLIALAGFVAAGLGGLGFMFWKRNADRTREQREREDELRIKRSGRNRSSGGTSNFSQNDYEHMDNVLSGATDGSRGDLDVPSDPRGRQDDGTTFSVEEEKPDQMGFYRDALTNFPEALKRIEEEYTVIGVSMAPGHGSEELATLERDTLATVEKSDFWALDRKKGEGKYAILPGIKQNINAAYLVSDDGRTAEKEFRGIFDIKPGVSFDLERPAEAEGDGSSFKITRKGVVQLPNK